MLRWRSLSGGKARITGAENIGRIHLSRPTSPLATGNRPTVAASFLQCKFHNRALFYRLFASFIDLLTIGVSLIFQFVLEPRRVINFSFLIKYNWMEGGKDTSKRNETLLGRGEGANN